METFFNEFGKAAVLLTGLGLIFGTFVLFFEVIPSFIRNIKNLFKTNKEIYEVAKNDHKTLNGLAVTQSELEIRIIDIFKKLEELEKKCTH